MSLDAIVAEMKADAKKTEARLKERGMVDYLFHSRTTARSDRAARRQEVVREMRAAGHSRNEIAEKLGVAPTTISSDFSTLRMREGGA